MPKHEQVCPNGHRYSKSSKCPTCPICASENKAKEGFMKALAAPAQRALIAAQINSLEALSQWSLHDLSKLHGIGKTALNQLQQQMLEAGLQFKSIPETRSKQIQKETISDSANGSRELLVQEMIACMLGLSDEIELQVRWNSPALVYTGPIQPFDAKEYKRDMVVFHLANPKKMHLIFIHGVRLEQHIQGLEGKHADGRRMISIKDREEWLQKKELVKAAIACWLTTVERK